MIRSLFIFAAITIVATPFSARAADAPDAAGAPDTRPRLIVLTDIGGDPDDQQSLIRLLVHADEFEIEGLIASAAGVPGELSEDAVKPQLIREIVTGYGKVHANLLKHSAGFPSEDALLERIKSGNPKRGMTNIGDGKDTEGSNWIIKVADRKSDRPVNITIWGGSTELAQALWRVRKDRTPQELKKFLGNIRVYTIGHQDDTGPWIADNFPDLFHVLSMAPRGQDKREGGYRGMYLGGDQSLTSREWVEKHLKKDHGPLGALYPMSTWTAPNPHATMKEGDTPSWLYFFPNGLDAPHDPTFGGWGGRFKPVSERHFIDAADTVGTITEARANVWRWRPAFANEFQARMDWCVQPREKANHPPVAMASAAGPGVAVGADASAGTVGVAASAGAEVMLSAGGSKDPDGDELAFRWWVYPEAGTYRGVVRIDDADAEKAKLHIPADAGGKTIHILLEVTDKGAPPLVRYRRVVATVAEK